jgi:hypothetical protein
MADQSHPIPKYSRISRAIIALIQAGDIGPRAWTLCENKIITEFLFRFKTKRALVPREKDIIAPVKRAIYITR